MRQDHKISRANSAPSERIKSAEQFVKLSRRKISWENCKLAALSGARDKNLAPSYHQRARTHTYLHRHCIKTTQSTLAERTAIS
jgi:hypothetical protein